MKLLTRTAAIFVGAILASPSVFAQTYTSTPNDLLFGFQNQAGGGSQDYIINLGAASSIIGQTTVVDLNGDFSLGDFNAVLGSSSSMFGGVIGAASSTVNGGTGDIFATQLRIGGAGTASVAGSSAPGAVSRATDNSAYSDLGTLDSPTAGTGGLDANKTWESDVEPTFTAGSFYGTSGINPDSSVNGSSALYEDLWESSSSSLSGTKSFAYEGYFTLNAANNNLTFTGADVTAAPEPSGYLISGLGGILMLLLRFRPGRRNA